MKQAINIVWIKRDIRSQDHLPLHEAKKAGLPYNRSVFICQAGVIAVLEFIAIQYEIVHLFSYQEFGIQKPMTKIYQLQPIVKKNKIEGKEFQRDGIVRGIKQ